MRHRKIKARSPVPAKVNIDRVKETVLLCVGVDEIGGAQKAREVAAEAAHLLQKINGNQAKQDFLKRLLALGLKHRIF